MRWASEGSTLGTRWQGPRHVDKAARVSDDRVLSEGRRCSSRWLTLLSRRRRLEPGYVDGGAL